MLVPWKKNYEKSRQHIKKQSYYLPTKVHIVKYMFVCLFFPVVMYGCETWTIKKVECQRIDAFEPWCWGRLLTVPWTARRSNQSILKGINLEYSLEGLMLKLKFQHFAHLMPKSPIALMLDREHSAPQLLISSSPRSHWTIYKLSH